MTTINQPATRRLRKYDAAKADILEMLRLSSEGVKTKAIRASVAGSVSTIYRSLAILRRDGMAFETENEGWRLGSEPMSVETNRVVRYIIQEADKIALDWHDPKFGTPFYTEGEARATLAHNYPLNEISGTQRRILRRVVTETVLS